MHLRPDMILIGSAGPGTGRTAFGCELIRRHAPRLRVNAAKVTLIGEGDPGARFALTEALDPALPGAANRMLGAGAHRAFQLQVRAAHLAEGVGALLEAMPAGEVSVCLGGAARAVVEPGLFLMLRPRGEAAPLDEGVRGVTFDGAGWDPSPDQCHCHRGVWSPTCDATAVILAGGRSSRMGRDKTLLEVGGQPLIARLADQLRPLFPEVLVSADDAAKYRFLDLPVIRDAVPDQGPLMGILSSLRAAGRDRVLVLAADIPVAEPAFIRELLRLSDQADVVMPVDANGRSEPLFAVYRKTVIPRAEAALAAGQRRVTALLSGLTALQPPMPAGWYRNLNTPEDYARFLREDG